MMRRASPVPKAPVAGATMAPPRGTTGQRFGGKSLRSWMRTIIISFMNPSRMTRLKTLTFALVHMSVAFTVVAALTGSWALGGAIALIEPAINTVAYFFHETLWQRLRARHRPVSAA